MLPTTGGSHDVDHGLEVFRRVTTTRPRRSPRAESRARRASCTVVQRAATRRIEPRGDQPERRARRRELSHRSAGKMGRRSRRVRARNPEGPGPGAVAAPPIASHILDGGHAWIASGYRAREYQPQLVITDLVALRELFLKEIGQPRWTIIYGQSMGGHIVVASLELHPGLYQGGLAECGLVDGISIADYLMAYTAAAELFSGVPLLDAPDKEAFARVLNERVVPALGMPGDYTARGRQFD